MRTTLAVTTAATLAATLATAGGDLGRVAVYMNAAKADATRRAYAADWRAFAAWCATDGGDPSAPQTVARYFADLADQGTAPSTIERRAVGLRVELRSRGIEEAITHAAVRETLKGIRRTVGRATRRQAAPLLADATRAIATELAKTAGLKATRDRALILLGFSTACRESELCALTVADLTFNADGVTVTVRRSKTDQDGEGRRVGVPFGRTAETCPVRAVRAWLDASGIIEGPAFRAVTRHGRLATTALSTRAVDDIVRHAAAAAGLDAAHFSGHSMRAGLATSAARAGVPEASIMRQTGHRSLTMVRRYIREGELYRDNAAAGLL